MLTQVSQSELGLDTVKLIVGSYRIKTLFVQVSFVLCNSFFVAAVMPPYAAIVGSYRVKTLWVQVLVVLHTHTPI